MKYKKIFWTLTVMVSSSCMTEDVQTGKISLEIGRRGPRLSDPVVLAPGDTTTDGQFIHLCMNDAWTEDCDHVTITPDTFELAVPVSGSISLESPFYEFDPAEIARLGGPDGTDGGAIRLSFPNPSEGCSDFVPADMRAFWQNVTLENENKTLVWNSTVAFDYDCPLARNAAHLVMTIRLPWIYSGRFTGNAFILMSSDPADTEANVSLLPFQVSTQGINIASRQMDFVFVIDTTGSMWDDIVAIRSSATELVDALFVEVPDPRVAIIDFRDFPYSPYGGNDDYPFHAVLDFSSDRNQILAGIQSLALGYGADWPESVYSGLLAAIAGHVDHQGNALSPWRSGASKNILLMGDAPAHDPEPYTGYTMQAVLDAANAGGITVEGSPRGTMGIESTAQVAAVANPGIAIHTVQIGTDPGARIQFEALAAGTGGEALVAGGAGSLVAAILDVIDDLGGENLSPDTAWARPSMTSLWPANHEMVAIEIHNVVDPEGDAVTITITGITQDEPVVQDGEEPAPDATGVGTDRAYVRAERSGKGGGRVYRISFEARDGLGAESEGSVLVCVPHDRGINTACEDDGQIYDATTF